jgi:DNA replication and repair protein RecF
VPILHIELVDFRNFARWELVPGPELTVLVGPNATGKTNAIEAIQLVTAARSFRRPRWEDLVRWGADSARATLSAEEDGRPTEVSLDVTAAGSRAYRVNGQVKRRLSDVAGVMPSVTFTPDDLDLVKGTSDKRRGAIDDLGEQLSPAYAAVRRDYGRVVRHRNALLREGRPSASELVPWDDQLVSIGAKLLVHRLRLLRRMAAHLAESYQELAEGEDLTTEYVDKAGLDGVGSDGELGVEQVASALTAALESRRAEENARQVTLVGPHRDDVVFRVGGKDARTFGSQGQQRTIALAWKLSEVRVVEDIASRRPVLLLDDVMSELDERRRRALTEVVRRAVQTFVTTTNLGYFERDLLDAATIVELGG